MIVKQNYKKQFLLETCSDWLQDIFPKSAKLNPKNACRQKSRNATVTPILWAYVSNGYCSAVHKKHELFWLVRKMVVRFSPILLLIWSSWRLFFSIETGCHRKNASEKTQAHAGSELIDSCTGNVVESRCILTNSPKKSSCQSGFLDVFSWNNFLTKPLFWQNAKS